MDKKKKLSALRDELKASAPTAVTAYFELLAPSLIPSTDSKPSSDKTFNDPVWKSITLPKDLVAILDLPLLQRLRFVRQLGAAHFLYPGAHHSRLEHSVGTAYAAGEMFNRFYSGVDKPLENPEGIRRILSYAALLHDCGHTVFSHVGENILVDLLGGELESCREIFNDFFPHIYEQSHPLKQGLRAGAAEIASVLLIISPAFEAFISRNGYVFSGATPEQTILAVASLVLGRPHGGFLNDSKKKTQHTYLASIVSGDLDADKIDYVARDAYYAGVLVSVDITRLLAQLRVVQATSKTHEIPSGLKFDSTTLTEYLLPGISHSGVSAFEMFVFTRSYLYDRIYTHHKVKAAELSLEKLIILWFELSRKINKTTNASLIQELYCCGGDDAFLGMIIKKTLDYENGQFQLVGHTVLTPSDEEAIKATCNYIRTLAVNILNRILPHRALGLSLRTIEKSITPDVLWNEAHDLLSGRVVSRKFVAEVAKYSNVNPLDIHIFSMSNNPVKEDPDLWIAMSDGQALRKVNHQFNTEQLANAYRDIKMIKWFFSPFGDQVAVAAATAFVLKKEYDIVINRDAIEKAKLSLDQVSLYLKKTIATNESIQLADAIENSSIRLPLVPPATFFKNVPQCLTNGSDKLAICDILARGISDANLPRTEYQALSFACVVLESLLVHANSNWGCISYSDEAEFQIDLVTYLRRDKNYNSILTVDEHTRAQRGFTDLVITQRDSPGMRIVVELKHEKASFSTCCSNHAGQSSVYSSEGVYPRVSILYVNFFQEGHVRLADSILVRKSDTGSNHAIICLGGLAERSRPSEQGKKSTLSQ